MSTFDQKEKDILDALCQIQVDASQLTGQVNRRLHEAEDVVIPRRMGRSMSAAAVIAIVMSSLLVVTATAAALGGFDWLMEKFQPPFAEIVEAVELSCEDQGIRMEVIGAQKYENMAVVYLSLQDISGQNRLTEQTSFQDGFWIKMNKNEKSSVSGQDEMVYGVSYQEKMLYFDQATNTIYYEFNLTADAQSPLAEPLEISSSRIYFDERKYELEPISISLADLPQAKTLSIKKSQVWGGKNSPEQLEEEIQVLVPGNYGPMPHGEKDQWVSNVGQIKGMLHVQISRHANQEFGSSDVGLSLVSADGEVVETDNQLYFLGDENGHIIDLEKNNYADAAYKYDEAMFSIGNKSLDQYQLCFTSRVTSGVKGKWKVTTNLNDSSQQIRILTEEVQVEDCLFQRMTLNPLGVQVIGTYQKDAPNVSELLMIIETVDGDVFLGSGAGGENHEAQTFNFHWNAETPLDVSKVTAIMVNDIRIPMK